MPWDLLIDRADLAHTELVEGPVPESGPGQAVLRVDRVGLTSNNITYAVFGDAMQYWDFFPTDPRDGVTYGRVPLWGFSVVQQSEVPELEVGTRLFGYVPTSSHLLIEPTHIGPKGLRDAAPHRQHLPAVYNSFTMTAGDLAYRPELEDLQALYRPLFLTSFVLADFITDNGCFGGDTVVLSSASSKTAYGTAFLLDDVRTVGLTSAGNREFVEGLGCYDQVVTYDDIAAMPEHRAVFVDVAGDGGIRRAVHERLAPVHSAIVGASHHDAPPDADAGAELPGAPPTFFFAPDQIRKRTEEWGPDGVDGRYAEAWARFAPVVSGWVDVEVGDGPAALEADWQATLAGSVSPSTGLVISF